MTISELTINNKSKENANTNIYLYSAYVLLIFTLFGSLISVIIATTGFNKLGHNWIVNAFFFRIYFGLGLSFLGAFELSLPRKWRVALIQKADLTQRHGMFYKALTLPIVTFSSTFPMIVLVLLFAGRGGIVGSVVGMFAFSLGMITPYIFPTFINLLPITVLNQVKVLLGFLALYLSLKFLSNFALALNFTFLDRDLFIELCIVLALILGLYMMGVIRFNNDFPAMENDFSQQYVSLIQLLIAIVSFTFIVYLIPGLWGASLKALTGYLPPPGK
ncbi:MAG: hypothetical protein EBX41_03355 [Chitinophagia bacterium]|nr:hypothetical protein [Chitinophagia bacterium]